MPPLMNHHDETDYNCSMDIFATTSDQCCPNEEEQQRPNKKRRLNSANNNKSKSVTFAPYMTQHSSDKTLEEVSSSWYSHDEMISLKQERTDFVAALRQVQWNLNAIPSGACRRGFEVYSCQKLNRDIRTRRERVVRYVLKEQQRQRLLHKNAAAAESIRNVSVAVTQPAQERAFEMGAQDSHESWMDSLLDMEISSGAGQFGEARNDSDDWSFTSDDLDKISPDDFVTSLEGSLLLQPLPCS